MTVCGICVVDHGRAFAWTDSEVYIDGVPNGPANKMVTNTLLGVVGVGTGTVGQLRQAAFAVQVARTVGEMLEQAQIALLSALYATPAPAARAVAEVGAFAVICHDAKFGRVVGWLMRAADDFRPAPCSTWCAPVVAAPDMFVDGADAVLAVAQAQLVEIRRTMPDATGGTLVLAELDGFRITTRPLADLVTGARPARLPGSQR